jgi:dephospho-CoA kinase
MNDAVQLSLPLMPATIEELYLDQAMDYGPGVFAAYTPFGIHQIDSQFCMRILNISYGPEQALERIQKEKERELNEASKECLIPRHKEARLVGIEERAAEKLSHVGEDPEKLREEIIVNPHLHACIKENLIENLDRILEELKENQ